MSKKKLLFFSLKTFNSVDIDLKMHFACGICRNFFSKYCWINIYRWKLTSIVRPCKIVWSRSIFAWCILWSTTRVWALWSLKKNNFWFVFFFYKLFPRGGSIPKPHLKTFKIFFSGPDFLKIYLSVGLTASMWRDESLTHRDIFLKSGSEKNVFKTVNS